MKLSKFNKKGENIGEIEVAEDYFGTNPNMITVYELLRAESANKRNGNASTKGRSEVRRTKSKPWRQKGTGRARSGTAGSPVWVGGGVVFGPKPRDYSNRLPRKIKKNALRSIFCIKLKENKICLLEEFINESGKTKDSHQMLSKIKGNKKTIILDNKKNNDLVKRSIRNIKDLSFLDDSRLEGNSLFNADIIVMEEPLLEKIKNQLNMEN